MKWSIKLFFISIFICQITYSKSQRANWNSSKIYHEIEKLKNTGTVLYLAAHPDDENTKLISWLANEAKVRTIYLSLTRGDGGQNLIGTEKGASLGVLRTQELLAARRIDGGEQLFTRAVDFGYSKEAKETFEKWDKEKILADLVFAIRSVQPDIIITRFPPDKRAGHGHHQASAILAEEAFKLAAKEDAFVSQFEFVRPWQVKRLMHNSSKWFDKNLGESSNKKSQSITINVGTYNTLLGENLNSIASRARSQHKCQGFGTRIDRGDEIEYLKYVAGLKPKNSLFEDIKMDWKRVGERADIEEGVDFILENFDFKKPAKSIPSLIALYQFMDQIPQKMAIVPYKKERLLDIITACAGLHYEANAQVEYACKGEEVTVDLSTLNSSELVIRLKSIIWNNKDSILNKKLNNQLRIFPINYKVPLNANYSQPFWLNSEYESSYVVNDPVLRNLPENPVDHYVRLQFEIKNDNEIFTFSRKCAIKYTWEDKVKGELKRDLVVLPKLTLSPLQKSVVLKNKETKKLRIKLSSHANAQKGLIYPIEVPDLIEVIPDSISFSLNQNEEEIVEFELRAAEGNYLRNLKFAASSNGKIFAQELVEVDYDHFDPQILLKDCETRLSSLNIKRSKNKLAYIAGSGDKVPEALIEMGYTIEIIERDEILEKDLAKFETILIGIRAFNIDDQLKIAHRKLMKYVEDGGHLIVQYNTFHNLKIDNIGPFPITLSRLRVTDENASVQIINKHEILSQPHEISAADFDNWVQERGLYFAEQWDDQYTPLFSMADAGEDQLKGSTLICHHGQGSFIYTGISFFRQLEAGVPGAYRLFSNFIEYEQKHSQE
ncbi:MAG: PIG-L family deacetylase [Bacteroidota bacterium]